MPQRATEWHWTDGNKAFGDENSPGVKFQDGEPPDATAVKFSLEPHLMLPGSHRKAEIGAITALDPMVDHTVKLVLSAPGNRGRPSGNSYYIESIPMRQRDIAKAKQLLPK